jgi:hypothetical protein
MRNRIAAKSLTIKVCAAVLSLSLLTLGSCSTAYYPPDRTREAAEYAATREAKGVPLTREAETAIAGIATYEARATREAEATEAAATAAAEVTHTSEERASTEPALEITKMATKVLRDDPVEGVADIDYIFTVKYATAGHTAFLVCYEENVESERTPISAESGTAEVIVHLVNYDYYGAEQYEPFCELRAASSDEVLAEAHPGPDTVYGD